MVNRLGRDLLRGCVGTRRGDVGHGISSWVVYIWGIIGETRDAHLGGFDPEGNPGEARDRDTDVTGTPTETHRGGGAGREGIYSRCGGSKSEPSARAGMEAGGESGRQSGARGGLSGDVWGCEGEGVGM